MIYSIVTDQISRDVDTACEQVTSWGGRSVELRGVGEGDIGSNLSAGFLDGLCATLSHWDVKVTGIAPQAFKIAVSDPAMRYHRRILLPASLHLAVLLGAPVVHVGVPKRPAGAGGPCPDDALEVLAEAAELAGNLGLTLGIENEPGTWAETGAELAAIAKAVGHHAVKLTWDPAVSLMAGEPSYPMGLRAVRESLTAVRVRDVYRTAAGFEGTLPGDGLCAVPDLIAMLAQGGFAGTLALDPRLVPRLEGARAAFETVNRMLQQSARATRQ
jgi:sugar phosphate isomerase/epimerase